jgi:hypothetical protein
MASIVAATSQVPLNLALDVMTAMKSSYYHPFFEYSVGNLFKVLQHQFLILNDADETFSIGPGHVPLCGWLITMIKKNVDLVFYFKINFLTYYIVLICQ